MADFIKALIYSSEKAANLARAIRAEHDLFSLLVQEKDNGEKNARFVRDFKTLADVLIQETIRYDLTNKFPEINPCDIHGEESNRFTNGHGESIEVEVQSTQQETAALLSKVLNGNMNAAELLATVVHSNNKVETDENLDHIHHACFPLQNFGIWIDPIDSTAEYIHGKDENIQDQAVCTYGLPCVTVLIGVYDKTSGEPIIGVVNQPFFKLDAGSRKWSGRHFWGIDYSGQKLTSVNINPLPASGPGRILISASESEAMKGCLRKECKVLYAAGAGYKFLCVLLGLADAYILSKGTTYRWDSCASHALLKSIGGGVISYNGLFNSNVEIESLEFNNQLSKLQLNYDKEEKGKQGPQKWCNLNGIIAYRDTKYLQNLIKILKCQAH